MFRWFAVILDWLAPRVCPACEGGSGALRDPMTGAIRVCSRCQGSGRESDRR